MAEIRVQGDGWSHDVLVGPLRDAAPHIAKLCGEAPVPLVSDPEVLSLHGASMEGLADFRPVALPRGEQAKTWEELRRLIRFFDSLGVTRRSAIVAFGGGSVGDVAGLAASLFKRGCPIIHMPTTLLAMVDSAVGGKTSIDDCGQKNLVGSFHPPALVVCDPAFLGTLDERQYRAGYAEVVKYGLIDDPAFFEWCEDKGGALVARDPDAQHHAIAHCVAAKARFVGSDLHDRSGRRALLNLGHSFAHAIEARAGLGQILHGEAVAVGLAMAYAFSARLGLCSATDSERVVRHLAASGLPASLSDVGLSGCGTDLMPFIAADKKAGYGSLTLILAHGIGQAFVAESVEGPLLAHYLEDAT